MTAPIVGPRTVAQLEDALAVLDRALDDDARAACDALVHPGNAVVDFHNTAGWMRATVDLIRWPVEPHCTPVHPK